ncbi:MAG: trypsin-like peptidase domain-containing protein [Acidobacteriota bacterium]|nr:MAG: trypsin-like peptidase domain-containing protein [Acidobacteriota bacterium]
MSRLMVTVATIAVAVMFFGSFPVEAQNLRDVFERVNPAVVVIRTTSKELAPWGQAQFVGVSGIGSGVLISDDGKIMTAAHVVHTALEIEVEFLTGEVLPAKRLASEPAADLALLQVERVPDGITAASLGDSDAVRAGDEIFVIGAPYGIDHTLTVGHISGRHRGDKALGGLSVAELLQTDAAINQGNSGGPMFNLRGEVIGIVSHIISQSGGFEGLGFVVTSNLARRLLIDEPGFWGGLELVMLDKELAELLNVPAPAAGALVQQVVDGSPAQTQAGLRGGTTRATIGDRELILGGDILLEIQDIPVGLPGSYERIRSTLRALKSGDEVRVKILRRGRAETITFYAFPEYFGG